MREKLAPDGTYEKDAAATLSECVEATQHDTADVDDHYFHVRIEGLFNPPDECIDVSKMREFLSQISPLPYSPDFPFGEEIRIKATDAGFPIDTIRLFLKDGTDAPVELFKPYEKDVWVKQARAPLAGIAYADSPTQKWFGWVARKRIPGAIKDPYKGIRVRIRNIQIDDTKIIRDIFAATHRTEKSRSSYSRFADWYVGEIFVDPKAAIPNARRDGFEENPAWEALRDELDEVIATPYGKQAYRTSQADKLSVANLTKAMEELEQNVALIEAEANPTREKLDPLLSDALILRGRIAKSMNTAEGDEIGALQALALRLGDVQRKLEVLLSQAPEHNCNAEIDEAISRLAQRLYKAFQERLAPQELPRVRAILQEVMGVEPE